MSANKHKPHVLILPEDDANRQLATGFCLGLDLLVLRRVRVLPVAGGWRPTVDEFLSEHVFPMESYPKRFMILLIDFDSDSGRLERVTNRIPESVRERVFILGAWKEPESLRTVGLGSYEEIGAAMARDCREETSATWNHDLLRHNKGELARLREHVRPILF